MKSQVAILMKINKMTNKPIKTIRDGNISISIFNQESKDGKSYLSFSFQKSRRLEDGTYKNEGISFFDNELLKVANLFNNCYNELKDSKVNCNSYDSAEYKGEDKFVSELIDDTIPF